MIIAIESGYEKNLGLWCKKRRKKSGVVDNLRVWNHSTNFLNSIDQNRWKQSWTNLYIAHIIHALYVRGVSYPVNFKLYVIPQFFNFSFLPHTRTIPSPSPFSNFFLLSLEPTRPHKKHVYPNFTQKNARLKVYQWNRTRLKVELIGNEAYIHIQSFQKTSKI